MSRFLYCCVRQMQKDKIRSIAHIRKFTNEPQSLIGGGLEKPQGGLKEEKYFYSQNCDLISKIRESSKLKCEDCWGDWKEYDKVLETSSEPTALSQSCSVNKHKNCMEEAFFLNEQNECCIKLLKENVLNNESKLTNEIENIQPQNTDNTEHE